MRTFQTLGDIKKKNWLRRGLKPALKDTPKDPKFDISVLRRSTTGTAIAFGGFRSALPGPYLYVCLRACVGVCVYAQQEDGGGLAVAIPNPAMHHVGGAGGALCAKELRT